MCYTLMPQFMRSARAHMHTWMLYMVSCHDRTGLSSMRQITTPYNRLARVTIQLSMPNVQKQDSMVSRTMHQIVSCNSNQKLTRLGPDSSNIQWDILVLCRCVQLTLGL